MVVAPSASEPPTAPANVTVPDPAAIVTSRAEVKLLSVPLNVMLLLELVKLLVPPIVTAPE